MARVIVPMKARVDFSRVYISPDVSEPGLDGASGEVFTTTKEGKPHKGTLTFLGMLRNGFRLQAKTMANTFMVLPQ